MCAPNLLLIRRCRKEGIVILYPPYFLFLDFQLRVVVSFFGDGPMGPLRQNTTPPLLDWLRGSLISSAKDRKNRFPILSPPPLWGNRIEIPLNTHPNHFSLRGRGIFPSFFYAGLSPRGSKQSPGAFLPSLLFFSRFPPPHLCAGTFSTVSDDALSPPSDLGVSPPVFLPPRPVSAPFACPGGE